MRFLKTPFVIGAIFTLGYFIVGAITFITGWFELIPISWNSETYKCQCPGTFRIKLTKDTEYRIWVYRKFRDRLKETGYLVPRLQLQDASSKLVVAISTLKQNPDLELNELENFGVKARTMFSFAVPKTGEYLLSCPDTCIVAVVPGSEEYVATTLYDHWPHYAGGFNDASFVEPVFDEQSQKSP